MASLENLIENLMAYEVQLQERKKYEQQQQLKKKAIAFNAFSDMKEYNEEEDNITKE